MSTEPLVYTSDPNPPSCMSLAKFRHTLAHAIKDLFPRLGNLLCEVQHKVMVQLRTKMLALTNIDVGWNVRQSHG